VDLYNAWSRAHL